MKNLLSLTCIALTSMLIACDDEQTQLQEQNKGPVITVVQPAPADSYSGDIVIEATAESHYKIVGMQIYLDNSLLASSSNDSILYILNSTLYADGLHTLKITATDKKGTTATYEAVVQISNSFITLNIVLNNQEPGNLYYYFLNDEDGNLVSDLKQVTATTTEVKFTTPAGHHDQKKYSLAYVEHWPSYYGYNAVTSISVVTGYTAGTYNEMIGYQTVTPTPTIGTHTVNFNDITAPIPQANFHTEVWGGFTYNVTGLDLALEKNGANAYVAVKRETDTAPLYKMLTGLNAGGTANLNLSDMAPLDGVTIPASPGSFSTFSFINGVKTPGNYDDMRSIWLNYPWGGGPMDFNFQQYYPGNAFPEYFAGLIESFPDHTDEYFSIAATAPSIFKRLNGGITNVMRTDTSLTFQSHGHYEFLQASSGLSTTSGPYSDFGFVVILRNGEVTYELPDVPQELTDVYGFPPLSQWGWSTRYVGTYIVDYSGLEGYDEYFNAAVANASSLSFNSWASHSKEYTGRSELFSPSSVRVRTDAKHLKKNYFARDKSWSERLMKKQ